MNVLDWGQIGTVPEDPGRLAPMYFNNDMLLTQVQKAITIFEAKYPVAQDLFIFDHAPSHMKKPEDSLNTECMNVKDGWKQPFMKDTV